MSKREVAPLGSKLLIAAILGLGISALYVPKISETWALAFSAVFVVLLIASIISMRKADPALLARKR